MADVNVRIVKKGGKKPVVKSLPKTASQVFSKNSLVEFASGLINPADDNDTIIFGVILEEIAATDDDYTSATALKQVEMIGAGDLVEMDTTATLTVGTSYGISNAYTVDATDTTNDVFTCMEVISSTRARGFVKSIAGGNTV